jgi:hypothetical protein
MDEANLKDRSAVPLEKYVHDVRPCMSSPPDVMAMSSRAASPRSQHENPASLVIPVRRDNTQLLVGFAVPALAGRQPSTLSWRADLNRRPADYESAALPAELRQQGV